MIRIAERTCQPFWLPDELLVKIAFFLSPKNIAQLLTVSTSWHQQLGDNELWIKLRPKISVEEIAKTRWTIQEIASDRFYLTHYPDLMRIHFAHGAAQGSLKVLKSLLGDVGAPIGCLIVVGETIIASCIIPNCYPQKIYSWDRSVCLQATAPFLINAYKNLGNYSRGFVGLCIINNHFVIAGYQSKEIIMKDRSTNDEVRCLTGHEDNVTCLAVGDKIIVSGSTDCTIRIWDEAGMLQRVLRGHRYSVNCLNVIGKTIISGSDNTIYTWDHSINSPIQTLKAQNFVSCLKATETSIISGEDFGLIQIWERSTSNLKHTLQTFQPHAIACLEIVDNIIITACDRTMLIWDFSTGAQLQKIDLTSPIRCMTFTDDTLVTGSSDGRIRIWGL